MVEGQEEKLVSILKEKFDGEIILVEQLYDFLTITLKKDRIIEIIRFLYDNPETKFQFLTTLFAVHYPDVAEPRTISGQASDKEVLTADGPSGTIGLIYQLHNMYTNERVRLKIYM